MTGSHILKGDFVEFLKRSQVSDFAPYYLDLDVIADSIDTQLTNENNPLVANAIEVLTKNCIEFQISCRVSFNDGWNFRQIIHQHNKTAAAATTSQQENTSSNTNATSSSTKKSGWKKLQNWLASAEAGNINATTDTTAAASSQPRRQHQTNDNNITNTNTESQNQASSSLNITDGNQIEPHLALNFRAARLLLATNSSKTASVPVIIRPRADFPVAEAHFKLKQEEKNEDLEMKEINNKNNTAAAVSSASTSATTNSNSKQEEEKEPEKKKKFIPLSHSTLLFVDKISRAVGKGFWCSRLVTNDTGGINLLEGESSASSSPTNFNNNKTSMLTSASSPSHIASSETQLAIQQIADSCNGDENQAAKKFQEITAALSVLQQSYKNLARVFLDEVKKVSNFYMRQAAVISSAVASCVDAAKCAKFMSTRNQHLYISAFRETFCALDLLTEFCEHSVLAITKAFDAVEQTQKDHIIIDAADGIVKMPFSLTKNSGLQLLRGDLLDAFRRSYLIARLRPDLVVLEEEVIPSTRNTPRTPSVQQEKEEQQPSSVSSPQKISIIVPSPSSSIITKKLEKQKQRQKNHLTAKSSKRNPNEISKPIDPREARRLLQNYSGSTSASSFDSGGSNAGAGGDFAKFPGGGGGLTPGAGQNAQQFQHDFAARQQAQMQWWSAPRVMFMLLFGLSIGLIISAATDFFSLQRGTEYVEHNRYSWWHFTVSFSFVAVLFMFALCVAIWEQIGVNYVYIFSLDPAHHWAHWDLLRNASVYLLWWSICAAAYCRRCLQEEGDWMLRSLAALVKNETASIFTSNSSIANSAITNLFDDPNSPLAVAYAFPMLTLPGFLLIFLYHEIVAHPTGRRRWFLETFARVVVTPYHSSVTFSDFVLAACCVTMGTMWFELQTLYCYWDPQTVARDNYDDVCFELRGMRILLLRAIPVFWRLAQCLRKYYEVPIAKRTFFPNGLNALKYVVVELALLSRFFLGVVKRTDENGKSVVFGDQHRSDMLLDAAIGTFFTVRVIDGLFRGIWDIFIDFGFMPYTSPQTTVKSHLQSMLKKKQQQQQKSESKTSSTTTKTVIVPENQNEPSAPTIAVTSPSIATFSKDDDKKITEKQKVSSSSPPKTHKAATKKRIIYDDNVDDLVALEAPTATMVVQTETETTTTTTTTSSSSAVGNDPAAFTSNLMMQQLDPDVLVSRNGEEADTTNNNNNIDISPTASIDSTTSPPGSPTMLASPPSSSDDEELERQQIIMLQTPRNTSTEQQEKSETSTNLLSTTSTKSTGKAQHLKVDIDAKHRQLGIRSHLTEVRIDAAATGGNDDTSSDDEDNIGEKSEEERRKQKKEKLQKQQQQQEQNEHNKKPSGTEQFQPCGYPIRPLLLPLWCYPVFIVIDVCIRFAWIGRYFAGQVRHKRAEWIPIVWLMLAVLRRFLWLVARVETAQVSNFELYGVSKMAPPPSSSNTEDSEKKLSVLWDDASDVLALKDTSVAVALAASKTSSEDQDQDHITETSKNQPTKLQLEGDAVDRFFSLLPQTERLAICHIALPLTHRRPSIQFRGTEKEGKCRWFASLRSELKVHALLCRMGKKTLHEYTSSLDE